MACVFFFNCIVVSANRECAAFDPPPITYPTTKLQNNTNNNNNFCISIVSTETSTTTSSFIDYNTPSPTSSHQRQQL